MQFDKRLWLARWAGDEEQVRALAADLGSDAERAGDVILQENLFEAQLTAAAAEALSENGFAAAKLAVKSETQSRRPSAKEKTDELFLDVSARIERKLNTLGRQLELKERRRKTRARQEAAHPRSGNAESGLKLLPDDSVTELFVERQRTEQRKGRLNGGRFWRIGPHPDGLELRSYLLTRQWVRPSSLAARLEGTIGATTVGQHAVELRARGEQVIIHADGRVHCIARAADQDSLVDLLGALARLIDELWS
jgi:hypothetical protein